MGFLSSIFGDSGKRAGDIALAASREAVEAQEGARDYLIEREKKPGEARDIGLEGLMALFGGDESYQADLIRKLQSSPLYQQIIGNRAQGEEAILRNAAATGGFRSGGTQENLYDYNTRLENEALLESYNQELGGLRGLAGTPTNENAIAQLMSNIGLTQAQGTQAYGQAREAGRGGLLSGLTDIATLGATVFSDIRLKESIFPAGEVDGYKWYSWTWRKEAEKLGLVGDGEGVMAHEIMKIKPDAIGESDGYITVDYEKLGVV